MTKTYTTKQGDTFDVIAKSMLGDEHYLHLLIEANYSCRDIVIFPAGITLTLPTISQSSIDQVPENLPPWRKQHQTLQS